MAEEDAVRFFLRGRPITVYPPNDQIADYDPKKPGQLPTQTLQPEWVYGYRGRDTRCNVYVLSTGEIVYFVAAVVVLHHVDEGTQRHYMGHTDDVMCLAIHPNQTVAASGQVAGHEKKEGKPHVRVWDCVSLDTLKVIGLNDVDRAVSCVAFSITDGGDRLIVVDESEGHIVTLWNWKKGEHGTKISQTKSGGDPVLAAAFHPTENLLVMCGKANIAFWNIADDTGTLTKKLGVFDKHDKAKYISCVAFASDGNILSGDSNGNLYVWSKETHRIQRAINQVHSGGLFDIHVNEDGSFFTGGGKDRRVVQWSPDYEKTGVEHQLDEEYGGVRIICPHSGGGESLFVGTIKNSIVQLTLGSGEVSPVVQGHADELWGLAIRKNRFFTVGNDKTLYAFHARKHHAIMRLELPEPAHCVAIHPEGSIVAVGSVSEKWFVIDCETKEIIFSQSDGNEQIECIQYSPDGNYLALGSRTNFIYVYAVSEDARKYTRIGKCTGHSSFVTHLDWSVDSQYFQTTSGDYELLYWTAHNCHHVTAAQSMRDVDWATQTCTLGFTVFGIWQEGSDGTDVNACARSNGKHLLASADDFGKVNLFKYPTCKHQCPKRAYPGHSSHVTNVGFLDDDSALISTGGKDTAVIQWKIVG